MVGNAGASPGLDPPFSRLRIARRGLDLGRETIDPPGLVRQKPVEVSTPSLEVSLQERGAAQDRPEEPHRTHHQGQQRQAGEGVGCPAQRLEPSQMRALPIGDGGEPIA